MWHVVKHTKLTECIKSYEGDENKQSAQAP
jgi:hypothetical protein